MECGNGSGGWGLKGLRNSTPLVDSGFQVRKFFRPSPPIFLRHVCSGEGVGNGGMTSFTY